MTGKYESTEHQRKRRQWLEEGATRERLQLGPALCMDNEVSGPLFVLSELKEDLEARLDTYEKGLQFLVAKGSPEPETNMTRFQVRQTKTALALVNEHVSGQQKLDRCAGRLSPHINSPPPQHTTTEPFSDAELSGMTE